ncbi:hypothetical protein RVR_10561 [Actinacidiphila reveromycinica]|uniref:Uncharacterized protein n=1 Tax=Actinacidiphila reveromycinica TaxID=659352 RepID=A0A7U3UXS9_9ACTN|nr:hypothetical protein [Streptomyces sp. SN-593]BBB00562.1 hypothetical protein RVR_7689 [Streptomyces sp. SN-593]BBB00615.1 hypothetical protein RVR_10561 [Streptomyces sp. SN-593]
MQDSAAGAATMKALRRRRGLSLAGTARALTNVAAELRLPALPAVASVQRSVARWEAARPTRPDDRYQLLLGHLYARTPAGSIAIGPGSDFAELLTALHLLGEGERRTAELRTAVLRAATDQGAGMLSLLSPALQAQLAAALADPARTTDETVAGLAAAVADVNGQVGTLPMVRLQLLLAPAVDAARRLLAAPVPSAPLQESLREAAVAAYTVAARLAFETRDDEASRAAYTAATREAAQLGRPWRQAGVHMSHALTTMYATHDLAAARVLADRAVRAAQRGESILVRARAHALQAEMLARAGQARQVDTALRLAWYDMEANHAGDPAVTSFSAGHLRGFEGVCELHVGDPATAHDRFAHSAAALAAPRELVQRAIVTVDQALARIRMGAPQDAVELLHQSVDAAAATGGRVPALRLRDARQALRPWRQETWVMDLDDHLLDGLGA